MILKTKEFQEAANKILVAVNLDRSAANLELVVKDSFLCLSVTNREYFVSIKFKLEKPIEFHAVVDANLFLNLISSINTEEFELIVKDNYMLVKAGKSNYKLAMIYENDQLMKLPVIKLDKDKVTIDVRVDEDIIISIMTRIRSGAVKAARTDVH